jgi:hypothetical protein
MAGLAVRVRVALAVARLRVGAAPAAHPLVARLDRPCLRTSGIVEVRLDRRQRAAEAVGDLRDREALWLAKVPCQRDRATPSRTRSYAPEDPLDAMPSRYCSNGLLSRTRHPVAPEPTRRWLPRRALSGRAHRILGSDRAHRLPARVVCDRPDRHGFAVTKSPLAVYQGCTNTCSQGSSNG